jgi:hypothetical protein
MTEIVIDSQFEPRRAKLLVRFWLKSLAAGPITAHCFATPEAIRKALRAETEYSAIPRCVDELDNEVILELVVGEVVGWCASSLSHRKVVPAIPGLMGNEPRSH